MTVLDSKNRTHPFLGKALEGSAGLKRPMRKSGLSEFLEALTLSISLAT
jgi:hypothetical protein